MTQAHDISAWADRAACIGSTDHLMPEQVMKSRHVNRRISIRHAGPIEHARIVCRSCPVLAQCESWALGREDPVPHHIAAAMTPFERNAKRRERYGNAKAPTPAPVAHGARGPKDCTCDQCHAARLSRRDAVARYRETHADIIKARQRRARQLAKARRIEGLAA